MHCSARWSSCAISTKDETTRFGESVLTPLPDPHTTSRRLTMNGELNFEVMPFEAYEGFQTSSAPTDVEMEEEFGQQGRSRGASARAPWVMPRRSKTPSLSPLRAAAKPPVRRPPFTLPKWPWGAAFAPYGAAAQPFPAEPQPAGSEYMRWVQSALNDVLGLRLQLHS